MLDKLKAKLGSGGQSGPQYVQSSPSTQPQYVQASPPPQPVYYQQPPSKSHELNAVTPATILTLVATILLLLVSMSAPMQRGIAFATGQNGAAYGLWGFCSAAGCSVPQQLGYPMAASIGPLGVSTILSEADIGVVNALLTSLVMLPIATAFAGLAFLLGLVGHLKKIRLALMSPAIACVGLASVLTLAALIIAFIVFAPGRTFTGGANRNPPAWYGNAIWMTLAALILLIVARGCFASQRNVDRVRRMQQQPQQIVMVQQQPPPQVVYAEPAPSSGFSIDKGVQRRDSDIERQSIDDRPRTVVQRITQAFDDRRRTTFAPRQTMASRRDTVTRASVAPR